MEKTGFTTSTDDQKPSKQVPRDTTPGFTELFLSFLRLGITAFGGPAMVAYIRDHSVKRKKWLDQDTFKRGVALCQTIPGATAIQVAAYVGLQTRGVAGALCTFIGFGLPAFALMVVLSYLYASASNLIWVRALFSGLQLAVVALVANATYTFGKEALRNYRDIIIAGVSASLFWIGVSPFYVILGSVLAGLLFERQGEYGNSQNETRLVVPFYHIMALIVIAIGGIASLYLFRPDLFLLALVMIKVDIFAFGGGFASVPLMLQEIVNVRGWMSSNVFMDGIALGQITPGPIVITSTFVGYLLYGLPGAVIATVAMFTPSFLLVIIIAGFFEKLNRSPWFRKALKGVFASFVGLLLYVTVKFAFAVPWSAIRVLIVCAALAALLKKIDILYVVFAVACLGVILFR
ncbi:MAG: chromate efflux transporter [Syntrophorhabdus sp.]